MSRHYLEEELYARIQQDSSLFDFFQAGSLDGIWYWDIADPAHEWYSPALAETLGYRPEDVPMESRWWQEKIFPEDLPRALENFEQHLEDPNVPYDLIVRYRHHDQSTVWIRCRGLILRDDQGQPIRMIGAHTDVTEIKRAEERARALAAQLEARNRELLHQSEVLARSAGGHQTHETPTVVALGGAQFEETSSALAGIDVTLHRVSSITDVEKTLRESTPAAVVLDTRGPPWEDLQPSQRCTLTDSNVPILVLLPPQEGFPTAAAGFPPGATDVLVEPIDVARLRSKLLFSTEIRRRVSTTESLAAELSRSNHELERFAYAASHDLNEPLRKVSTFLSLLRSEYGEQLPSEAQTYIDIAKRGAERMRTQIADLLDYARVSSGNLEYETIDTDNLLTGVCSDLALALREAGGTVQWEDVPVVTGYPAKLSQLFQNLVGNAIKFRTEAPPQIVIRGTREAHQWRFSVSDNGIGIPEHHRQRVFGLFERLNGRSEYPGSGIGLATCRRIVEQHGGQIHIEGNQHGGTTVSFTLASRQQGLKKAVA